jgi:hypothetical protein
MRTHPVKFLRGNFGFEDFGNLEADRLFFALRKTSVARGSFEDRRDTLLKRLPSGDKSIVAF